MTIEAFGLSDIGVSRPNNEDVWIAAPEIGFFAIADGMGGHQAGEIAARETIDHLTKAITTMKPGDVVYQMLQLRHAIEKTNQWVYQIGQNSEALSGMGTTLCCLICLDSMLIYAHVGDSRIYRYRDRQLELLTQDHSLLAKWLQSGKESTHPFPYKNVITRAIGTCHRANPEIATTSREAGDLFLLCTDGLSDALSLKWIEYILQTSDSLEHASTQLIHQAKANGSSDNITILIVSFT